MGRFIHCLISVLAGVSVLFIGNEVIAEEQLEQLVVIESCEAIVGAEAQMTSPLR